MTETSVIPAIEVARLAATADIVSSVIRSPSWNGSIINLICEVRETLAASLDKAKPDPTPELVPAVPIRKSVFPDRIISLETGEAFKSMKRHLSNLGMTPEQYRTKWGLPTDYPIVAAEYSARRSQLAKENGLGRK